MAAAPPDLLRCVAQSLYQVVDRRWQTYCVFTSLVVAATAERLGFDAQLVPCQLVHMTGERMDLIGFTGRCDPAQWDGHLAVRVGKYLIDGTVANLRCKAGAEVPDSVAVTCLPVASNILARQMLDNGARLLWLAPPAGADTTLPPQARDTVPDLAARLARQVQRCCGDKAQAIA